MKLHHLLWDLLLTGYTRRCIVWINSCAWLIRLKLKSWSNRWKPRGQFVMRPRLKLIWIERKQISSASMRTPTIRPEENTGVTPLRSLSSTTRSPSWLTSIYSLRPQTPSNPLNSNNKSSNKTSHLLLLPLPLKTKRMSKRIQIIMSLINSQLRGLNWLKEVRRMYGYCRCLWELGSIRTLWRQREESTLHIHCSHHIGRKRYQYRSKHQRLRWLRGGSRRRHQSSKSGVKTTLTFYRSQLN